MHTSLICRPPTKLAQHGQNQRQTEWTVSEALVYKSFVHGSEPFATAWLVHNQIAWQKADKSYLAHKYLYFLPNNIRWGL